MSIWKIISVCLISIVVQTAYADELKPCSKEAVAMRGQFKATQKIDKGLYLTAAATYGGGIEYQRKTYQFAVAHTLSAKGFDTNRIFNMYQSVIGGFEITGTKQIELSNGSSANALLLEECKSNSPKTLAANAPTPKKKDIEAPSVETCDIGKVFEVSYGVGVTAKYKLEKSADPNQFSVDKLSSNEQVNSYVFRFKATSPALNSKSDLRPIYGLDEEISKALKVEILKWGCKFDDSEKANLKEIDLYLKKIP